MTPDPIESTTTVSGAEVRLDRKRSALELKASGASTSEIVRRTGLSRSTVSRLLRVGVVAEEARRGRKTGSGRLLGPTHEMLIKKEMSRETPLLDKMFGGKPRHRDSPPEWPAPGGQLKDWPSAQNQGSAHGRAPFPSSSFSSEGPGSPEAIPQEELRAHTWTWRRVSALVDYRMLDALGRHDGAEVPGEATTPYLSRKAIGNYLRSWGLRLPEEDTRPLERCSEDVRTWVRANTSELEHGEGAGLREVFWLNPPVKLNYREWFAGYVFPMGLPADPPLYALSAVSQRGTVHWKIFSRKIKAAQEFWFLRALHLDRQRGLLVIRNHRRSYADIEIEERLLSGNIPVQILPPVRRRKKTPKD